MDRSYEIRQRPEYVGGVKQKPSTYVKSGQVFFSVDPGESTLSTVSRTIGTDALFFASDFPHEVNLQRCQHELSLLMQMEELTEEEKRLILCDNTRRFYRLAELTKIS
jgi:predicted TIM-barrel fold metal-dependent hydrolase